jgi:alanyl-tRNA synthetase
MNSKNLKEKFLSFFKKNNHEILSGSQVIPENDETILFTNAGMNQFKNFFLGIEASTYPCVSTSQRCIRAGGKHNDLSEVGFTARHLTCFEMLGNFSFGSYFKKEAIQFAWNFLTNEIKFEKEKLWVTVFKEDNESYEIWRDLIKINPEKIIKLSEKDNFWQMGDAGPCGPCSEIYFDRGIKNEIDKTAKPGDDFSERFLEVWNLVFMQFNKLSNGTMNELSKKGVDTGMGLERLSMLINNKNSVFEIDLFENIFKSIDENSENNYLNSNKKNYYHVIADHLRTSCSIIAENIIPSNEGRGYVLRKIMRRAILYSKKLGNEKLIISLIKPFISNKNNLFYDLNHKISQIENVYTEEIDKFIFNLKNGEKKFFEIFNENKNIISGKDLFMLYDTYGFPVELTEIFAKENKIDLDYSGFEKFMNEQKAMSKNDQKNKDKINTFIIPEKTEFIGYENNECEANLIAIYINEISVKILHPGQSGFLIFDKTVFYATGGGQVADRGIILNKNKEIQIQNVLKLGNAIGLFIQTNFEIKINDIFKQKIDLEKRNLTSRNHTATHLLHESLQRKFGREIRQDGSFVCPEYFTLDCTIQNQITDKEIKETEDLVNNFIFKSSYVSYKNISYDEAIRDGAKAIFTNKYNKEDVRVVSVNNISKELCGGTHVKNTNEIGMFFIKDFSTLGSGIKRFTCITSKFAYENIKNWKNTTYHLMRTLKSPAENLIENIIKNDTKNENLKKELNEVKIKLISEKVSFLKSKLQKKDNYIYGFFELEQIFYGFEKNFIDEFNKKDDNLIIFLISKKENYKQITGSIGKALNLSFKKELTRFLNEIEFKGGIKEKFICGIVSTKNEIIDFFLKN